MDWSAATILITGSRLPQDFLRFDSRLGFQLWRHRAGANMLAKLIQGWLRDARCDRVLGQARAFGASLANSAHQCQTAKRPLSARWAPASPRPHPFAWSSSGSTAQRAL